MRALLITLNIVLAGVLLFAFSSVFESEDGGRNTAYSVKKRSTAKAKTGSSRKPPVTAEPVVEETHETMIKNIVSADIFNQERSPNSAFNGRGGRVTMTLVGTFRIGKIEGAIIQQNRIQRNTNPFIMMMGPGIGGQGGAWGNARNIDGGSSGARRNTRRSSSTGSSYRQRFQLAGQMQNQNTAFKQYVRLGETLSNGYTLVEVSRVRAVLTRGSDRMELELQDPSKSRNSGRRTSRKLSASQQLQQAQLITSQRMMQVMQQMQRTMSGQQRSGGATSRGRGRR